MIVHGDVIGKVNFIFYDIAVTYGLVNLGSSQHCGRNLQFWVSNCYIDNSNCRLLILNKVLGPLFTSFLQHDIHLDIEIKGTNLFGER